MKVKTVELDSKRIALLKEIINAKYGVSLRAKRKAKVILLKSEGKSIKEISKNTNLCKRTIISYINEYTNPDRNIGGMRFIHRNDYKKSLLKNVELSDIFKTKIPSTYKEATEIIKEKYDITISESATRRYLNKIGIYTKKSRNKSKRKR